MGCCRLHGQQVGIFRRARIQRGRSQREALNQVAMLSRQPRRRSWRKVDYASRRKQNNFVKIRPSLLMVNRDLALYTAVARGPETQRAYRRIVCKPLPFSGAGKDRTHDLRIANAMVHGA